MSRLRRLLACLSVLSFAWAGGAVSARADLADEPHWLVYSAAVRRGGGTELTGVSFRSGTTYDLSASAGTLTSPGGAPASSITGGDGYVYLYLAVDTATPLSVTDSTVTATSRTDGSTVTTTVRIIDPQLGPVSSCPAQTASFGSSGFADGTYHVHSAALIPSDSDVTAHGGSIMWPARWIDTLGPTATIQVTGADGTSFAYPVARSAASVNASSADYGQEWAQIADIGCLQPGETVTAVVSDKFIRKPATVTADASGYAHATVVYLPTTSSRTAAGVRFTGTSSHQTAVSNPARVWGTTLAAGRRLVSYDRGLLSANGRYGTQELNCEVESLRYRSDGVPTTSLWAARHREEYRDDCYLSMQTDGNLVLRARDRTPLWASHTAGTGTHNRLVMRDDGNLVIYTSADKPVWSSRTGIIRTASTMGEGQVLHRGERLRNGATSLALRTNGDLVVARHHRILWSSHRAGKGGRYVRLERNGILALRTSSGHAVWATRTTSYGVWANVTVRASGDVAVVDQLGRRRWHTATG